MNTQEVTIESTERSFLNKKFFIFDKRFLFETREEAEKILKQLRIECDAYGRVSLFCLGDLVLTDFATTDLGLFMTFDYGWTDLRKAFVTYTSDGYRLVLPTPIRLYQI